MKSYVKRSKRNLNVLKQSKKLNYTCTDKKKLSLPYLEPPYINPPLDLCAWGLGGTGGAFDSEEADISLEFRRAFGLGPPVPNGRRDGESNDTVVDLAFIPGPSHGFGGADIPQTLISILKLQRLRCHLLILWPLQRWRRAKLVTSLFSKAV